MQKVFVNKAILDYIYDIHIMKQQPHVLIYGLRRMKECHNINQL
jgi:hypothetical protein